MIMTINREITKALRSLRDKPEFGARTPEQTNAAREALLRMIGAEDVSRPVYTLRDYADTFLFEFRHAVLRPLMVGIGILVLAAGGWMTSVNAAYESVPGDMLYPIKIATEQAQLSITISDQKRAALHMEFASRRLAEASSISHSDSSDKTERMKSAVSAFKNEVAEAKTSLKSLQGSEEAVAVASALDAKANEYAASIDQTALALDDASEVDVAGAKEDAEQAGDEAVEVLVTSAEASQQQGVVTEDLQKSFQQNLLSIDAQVKLALGRVAVIQHVVAAGAVTLPVGTDLKFMTSRLQHVNTQVHEAMNIMAAGGYRSAFEQLDEIDNTISEVEAQIAALELSIVAQQDASVDLSPIE